MLPVLRFPLSRGNQRRLAVRSPMRRRVRLEFERLEARLELSGPTVSSVSPNTGPPAGGTDVTIGGTNFTNVQAVFFGTNQATNVSIISPITIEATSPAGTGVVDVTVQTSAGTSPITPADQFTYQTSTQPTVTGINPDNGPVAGGTSVTITGTNFTGATAVNFGTTAATNVTVVSGTTITATSPAAGGPGPVDVTVTTPSGTSPINRPADVFTYTTASSPTVTGINPNSGPVAGGTSVTITGTNFTGATAVDFGTTAVASFTVVSSTQITTTSPAAAGPGPVDVTVTTPRGTSPVTPSDVFTYIAAAPSVTGINPNQGPTTGGTSVTITGSGFSGATAVSFGTMPAASFVVTSSTTIVAVSPPGTGAVDVTVTAPQGTSAVSPADVFTYFVSRPTVTGISPQTGPPGGGTLVTITGTGFLSPTGTATVFFGPGQATNVTVVSATTITAVSPPGTGSVDVLVFINGIGSVASPADVFTYATPDGPRVVNVVRYGYHRQPTYFVIRFDTPLDPTSAGLVSNYSVIQSGIVGVTGKTVRVRSASYNRANHAVTLAFSRRLPLRQVFLLRINGTTPSGVKNLDGLLLDGAGTGRPGSDYVTTVSQNNLAGPASQRPVASVRRADARSLRDRVAQILRPGNTSHPKRSGSGPAGSAG